MPKDEWARLKLRDRAKKAIRSGEYYRVENPKKKKHKASIHQVRKEMRQDNATLDCQKCGPVLPILEPKTFKDGTNHISACCPTCKKFLKWIGR